MAKRKTPDHPRDTERTSRQREQRLPPSRTVETRVQALERRVGAVERALRQTRAKDQIRSTGADEDAVEGETD
jgi:hypothetical protein